MAKKIPQKLIRLSEMNPGGEIIKGFTVIFYSIGDYAAVIRRDNKGKYIFDVYEGSIFKFKSHGIHEVSKALHRLTGL